MNELARTELVEMICPTSATRNCRQGNCLSKCDECDDLLNCLLDRYDETIRANERLKFAEWLSEVTTFDCGYCQLHHDCYEEKYKGCVARLIEMYEKEQKNEH